MNPYNQQWRPTPPAVCPVCSHPHFPFCPSAPPLYSPSQPPLPSSGQNFPPISDSYHYHNPHPYHYRPPFHQDYVPPSQSVSNSHVPEPGRSVKRPRVEHTNYLNDERRLKLIRDHGSPVHGTRPTTWSPVGPTHQCYGNDLNNGVYRPFHSNNVHSQPNNAYGCQWYSMPPPRGLVDGVFNTPPHHPPLPSSPPPPPPPPQAICTPASASVSLFPVPVGQAEPNLHIHRLSSPGLSVEDSKFLKRTGNQISQDVRTVIDASHLFKEPYRSSRSDRFVVILRGLPGSGKSYMAKMMRDLEVENGGEAPRIHSMDDYFMTEIEKVDDCEVSKPSATIRIKKSAVKKVLEYCYEPEMEEVYRESMLKAFKKTLEEGVFRLVIVDDRNLRVADFAQFWATAKLFGYEVYISEVPYKDPVGCTARNVHGFTLEEIKTMATHWEDAPIFYLQLDVKTLFGGDDLKNTDIQEVDMDSGEDDTEEIAPDRLPGEIQNTSDTPSHNEGSSDDKDTEDGAEREYNEIRELGKSKWLDNLNDERIENPQSFKGNVSALSGLIKAYQKRKKSVRWSDQASYTGFSIGAVMKKTSLVIGPGAGYNQKSNPLSADETDQINSRSRNNAFHERMRAERESFKAVFNSSRQRIGGLEPEEG